MVRAQHSCSFIGKLDAGQLSERRSAFVQLDAVNSPLNIEYRELLDDQDDDATESCALNARLAILSRDRIELRVTNNGSAAHVRQCLLSRRSAQFRMDAASPASCRFFVEFVDNTQASDGDGDDDDDETDYDSLLGKMVSYYEADVATMTDRDDEEGADDNDSEERRRRLDVPLDSLLPKLVGQRPFSVVCVKCATSLGLRVTGESSFLRIRSSDRFAPTSADNERYHEIVLRVREVVDPNEQRQGGGDSGSLIVVRVLSRTAGGSSKRLLVRRQTSQQKYRNSNGLAKSNNNNNNTSHVIAASASSGMSVSIMPGSVNMLKTAQLAISEDTIGVQTKLKIYEHAWVDYQLNASDYVRERIALVGADQPMLNITREFDYETAGPLHTFQIIFTRRVDNTNAQSGNGNGNGNSNSNNNNNNNKRTVRDIKPIQIRVLDVNDEAPVWRMDEPVPYTAVVERDPRAGMLLFQFVADDPDTQSEIVYTLHSKSPNTSRIVLASDGKLLTEAGPPFAYDTYKVLVSAHDAKANLPTQNINPSQRKNAQIGGGLLIFHFKIP